MAAMDIRGAVLRGWRLLVLIGIVGAVAGYLSAPAKPPSSTVSTGLYRATVIVEPVSGKDSVSMGKIFLATKNPAVLTIAATKANVGVTAAQLAEEVGVENARTVFGLGKLNRNLKIKALGISVTWVNPTAPVALANALADAVETYLVQQAQITYSQSTARAAKDVANIESQLNQVTNELSGSSGSGGASQALVTQKRVLSEQLDAAVHLQLNLQLAGPKTPGYNVLQPAAAAPGIVYGKATVATVVNHRSTRILGGLIVGVLVAVGIILLVEVLDRSLRTVRATEEAFDLPVVAEIPARGPHRPSLQRAMAETRLEVVVAPGSPAAEAYRRLHTAVMLEPLASEIALLGNGNGYPNGYANGNGNGNGYANGNGNGYGNGHAVTSADPANGGETLEPVNGYGNGHGNGHGNGNGNGNGNGRKSRRQVVMVVSPGAEGTRSAVVANLAAVYAEAGAQALVMTMGNLNFGRPNGTPVQVFEPEGDIDPRALVPLSRPSAVDGVSRLQFDQLLASRGQVVTQGPAIITAARQVADAVLIDAPSLLQAHDAIALLPAVDVVLVVAQYAVTRSDEAREAGDMLRRFRAPLLGVAFTNVPRKERSPQGRGHEPEPPGPPTGVVLQGYDVPRAESAAAARLWL
jgi:Mrp family chromosome partitioning ATPase